MGLEVNLEMPSLSFSVIGLPIGAGSKRAIAIRRKVDCDACNHPGGDRSRCTKCDGTGRMWQFTGQAAVVDASGERGTMWRQDIKAAAFKAMADQGGMAPFDEPLILRIEFTMSRPKSHFRSGRNSHLMREDAPAVHSIAPDATKLTRAVEDALNFLVWSDDSRVVEQHIYKRYGDQPGATVTVTPWAEENLLRSQQPAPRFLDIRNSEQ